MSNARDSGLRPGTPQGDKPLPTVEEVQAIYREASERCGFEINPRHVCFGSKVIGFDHCRHHLTAEERARRGH